MKVPKAVTKMTMHIVCRNAIYPKSDGVQRFHVPDEKVPWNVQWSEYAPINYTSSRIKSQPSWADPPLDQPNFTPKWNHLDGDVNRKSHFCKYNTENGYPLNPMGRTGIKGRGLLGRWGPNHAADSIITRWKKNLGTVEHDVVTKKPILQFIAIERKDCHEWALPGGMVDPGEAVNETLIREFLEEALNTLSSNEKEKVERKKLSDFFSRGVEIFKGYVDDPRNTDNAWMETVAVNFHDEDDIYTNQMNLYAGDDANNVKWIDINSNLVLYASHKYFISNVAKLRNCHW